MARLKKTRIMVPVIMEAAGEEKMIKQALINRGVIICII